MATDIQAQDAHFAAEFSPDVDAEKVGSVYAAALFGALDDDLQKIGEVLDELRDFLKEAFDAFPEFEKTLVSRLVSVEDKLGILDRVFASKVSPVFFSFLQTVVKRERMDCLRAIYSEAVKIYDKLAGRVPVIICTATPIDNDVVEAIKEKLRQKWFPAKSIPSRSVVLSCVSVTRFTMRRWPRSWKTFVAASSKSTCLSRKCAKEVAMAGKSKLEFSAVDSFGECHAARENTGRAVVLAGGSWTTSWCLRTCRSGFPWIARAGSFGKVL